MMFTALQATNDSVQTLLVSRGYVIAFLLLVSMVYIRFETRQRFKRWVYVIFGGAIAVIFLFATGTVWFSYPAPGVIYSIGLTVLGFGSGVAIAWILWGGEDVFVRDHRERRYMNDEDGGSGDTDTDTDTDNS